MEKPNQDKPNLDQRVQLERKRQLKRRQRFIAHFANSVEKHRSVQMNYLCRRLHDINHQLALLGELSSAIHEGREEAAQRYVVSSLFLRECFEDLTADQNEQLFFVTGSEVDGTFVLDQKAEFDHTKRTVAAVVGNPKSTHGLLIRLEQFGHRLLGHFHSHPGLGLSMTLPSGTDRSFQSRLEKAGYPTVAAIFSRDGYIRFFRIDHEIRVGVHGKGVREVEPNIYQLTDAT